MPTLKKLVRMFSKKLKTGEPLDILFLNNKMNCDRKIGHKITYQFEIEVDGEQKQLIVHKKRLINVLKNAMPLKGSHLYVFEDTIEQTNRYGNLEVHKVYEVRLKPAETNTIRR